MDINRKIKGIMKQTRVSKNKKIYGRKKVIIDYKIHRNILILLLVSLIINITLLFQTPRTINEVKVKEIEKIPENIVFLGDSITHRYDLGKYFEGVNTVNSGEEGNYTTDILGNMYERVYRYNPSIVVLLIGTNDLAAGKSEDEIFNNIKEIVNNINEVRPKAKIYVESILPTNSNIDGDLEENRPNSKIDNINNKLKDEYKDSNVNYIDVNKDLKDENSFLREEYTEDGLHLSSTGYEILTNDIKASLAKKDKSYNT